jgi:hypothetical protein
LAKAAGNKYKSCDTQRQIPLANMREKCSLVFYWEMQEGQRWEYCIIYCNRNDRNGLARFLLGIWKLTGLRGGGGGG